MKLSIVATLYRSAPHLGEFHARTTAAAQALVGADYEFILVNDGSPDESLDIALQLAAADPHLVIVDLSRNFGHHKAMMTGLQHAQGDFVFLLDSDLEEDPAILSGFATRLEAEQADVVYGVQEKRKGGAFERITGALFYKLFRLLTRLDLPANLTTARLMSRRYVNALTEHREREVFIAGLWFITGFKQVAQPIVKQARTGSTYTLRRKIALLVNSVTSFSNTPLVMIFYIGLFISFFAALYTATIVLQWLFADRPMQGWASLMASIWLLGGLIISFMGIIGIYLSKIFSEAKQRPYSIVRQFYGRSRA